MTKQSISQYLKDELTEPIGGFGAVKTLKEESK